MCKNEIHTQIQIIKAEGINDAWEKVIYKETHYRYAINAWALNFSKTMMAVMKKNKSKKPRISSWMKLVAKGIKML